MDDRIYSKPEVLLGDLRGGLCSSGLCRQLRAVAADEIERLNKWADGFSDRQLEERRTGEAYQRELKELLREASNTIDDQCATANLMSDGTAELLNRIRAAMGLSGQSPVRSSNSANGDEHG